MTAAEALAIAVESGDEEAIRRILGPLGEDERAELAPAVRASVATTVKEGTGAVAHLRPVLLAAYGTLPATELRKLGWRSIHIPDRLEEVLRGRSPQRLEPIVALLLDVAGGAAWYPVRALVRDGIVAAPDGPAYPLALLAATRYRPAANLVATDPAVLEDEVWRLFEVEGGGEHSLAGYEKYTGDSWGDLFREQAAQDDAMRARLLDESLAALARDFGSFRAGWFSRFHESLEPTDDERARRASGYLRLLRSRTRPTVSFAVAALTRVSQAGRLEPAALLGSVEPVLTDAPAGTAKAALKLVRRAGAEPGHTTEAALVASAALAHPSADVERAALKLIDTLAPQPDTAVATAVGNRLGDVAASVRPAVDATLVRLGGAIAEAGSRTASTAVEAPAPPPAGAHAGAVATLGPERAVAPLESHDALIDTAVSVIETGEPAEDLERVLEAVGRLRADRTDGFVRATAALARRCRTILDRRDSRPLTGYDARADIAAVVWCWATAGALEVAPDAPMDPGAGSFLSARAAEVAAAAQDGVTFRSVALPSHVGGWIDPRVLVARLRDGPPASELDLVAALLRLAPIGRDEALRGSTDLDGEAGAVARYALGGDASIGPTASWWVAAARTRAPRADDEALERRHPGLGPDAGRAATTAIVERTSRMGVSGLELVAEPQPAGVVGVELPTVRMYLDADVRGWFARSDAAMLRWIATIRPGARAAWASLGAVVLARNVDWWSAEWANRVYLEPFVDPLTVVEPEAGRLIGVALGAKEAGERGLAADVVGLALADGRLSAGTLADGLAAAAAMKSDRPGRWALSLADVAAVSTTHARAVADAIARTLPVVADRRAAAIVPLLRLLDELLAATGGSHARAGTDALRALAIRSGQTARLARSILARA